jgi:hypothetical protein
VIGTDVTAPPNRIARLRDRLARWATEVPWARVIQWPAVIVFFTVAAIVQTWPLVKHLDDSMSVWWFFPYDAWQFFWNLWWVKHSIVDLQTNPFHSDLMLYPQGSNLYLHPLTFVSGILSIPLQVTTGNLILSYNIVLLLCLILSAIGAYALAYRATHNQLSAVLAAYIFAFTPFVFMRLGGHINIFATWPIPFFLLFLLRFRESGRLRDAVGAGCFWAVLTYNWLEFATDAGMILVIFFGCWLVESIIMRQKKRFWQLVRGGLVLTAVWFLISAPFLIPALRDIRSGHYFQPGGDESFSADLLTYVTPSPLWGPGESPQLSGPNPLHQAHLRSIEGTAYLGIVPLLLAAVAVISIRGRIPQVLPWLIAFVTFATLALGPKLWVNDSQDFTVLGISFSVPLPYQIYEKLPLAGDRRVPARMIVFGIMALAVLAAIGLDQLMSWIKRYWKAAAALAVVPPIVLAWVALERWDEPLSTAIPVMLGVVAVSALCVTSSFIFTRRLRHPSLVLAPMVGVMAIGIVALEFWNPPIAVTSHSRPEILRQISDDAGDFTVLEAPLGRRTGWTFAGDPTGATLPLYYQSLYEKATFGGYLSRVHDEGFTWFLEQPGLHFLACPSCPDWASEDDLDQEKVRQVFDNNKIRYVIVHRLDPQGAGISYVGEQEVAKMIAYLRDVVGMEQFYEDSNIMIFRDLETDGVTATR